MDPPKSASNDDDDEFFDALDDFDEFPFYDCLVGDQSDQSTSGSKEISSTLRRRSLSRRRTEIGDSKTSIGEKRYSVYRNFRENGINSEQKCKPTIERVESVQSGSVVSQELNEESTVTAENYNLAADSIDSITSLGESSTSSSLLVFIAGLIIKAISFQFNLLSSSIWYPISFLYNAYMFIVDPFRIVKRGREFLLRKLFKLFYMACKSVSPLVGDWMKENESIWKLVFRCGWGILWAIYVCCILCGLMFLSILTSGFLMRIMVEKPIQIKESLTFDYTVNSPVAFVPVMSCDGALCGLSCKEKKEIPKIQGSQAIPVNHKLAATVKLTMPESEYNRRLGMFQVRVDFLAASGETLLSSRHPCMLKFKSDPVRHLLTFLKAAPLVTGFTSETQTLNLKLRGFKQGDTPTSCVKVIIEQRAEYRPGAGIPEIYDASLILESELPLLKRIIWYWKKTIFVWVTMMSFIMELLVSLICCNRIILPRARPRGVSNGDRATQRRLSGHT